MIFLLQAEAQLPSKLIFTKLGKKQGLASTAVFQSVQDKQGFIWFATENGLQRFDGHNFLTFHNKHGDSTSIPGDYFNKLYFDSKNRLWLISGGEIGIFNTNRFTFKKISTTPPINIVKKIMEDKSGRILLVTDLADVLVFDEKAMAFNSKLFLPSLPPGYRLDNIVEDKEPGKFWITTKQGILYYDGKSITVPTNTLEGDTTMIDHIRNTRYPFVASNGSVWFISWIPFRSVPVLYNFQPQTKSLKVFGNSRKRILDNNYEIWSIRELKDGSIWIYGQGMLGYLDKNTNQFVHIKSVAASEYDIEYDYVVDLFEDKERNIWINSNKGLYRVNKGLQYFSYQRNRRVNDTTEYEEHVTSILPTKQGAIWVSTRGKGIFSYDSQWRPIENSFTALDTANKSLEVVSMIERSNGDFWLGMRNGQIRIYHPLTKTVDQFYLPGAKSESIRQLLEDRNKNIWVGNNEGDLYKFDQGNWRDSVGSVHLVDSQLGPITKLYEDWPGNLWIGTMTDGLYKRDGKTNQLIHHYQNSKGKDDGLLLNVANDIVQYNDSTILVASGNSLSILNTHTGKFHYITVSDGIPSERIINIIVDKKKRIWLAMLNGLYRLNLEKKIPIIYTEVNGLQSSNIEIASEAILPDGRIVVGTVRDFIVFNPDVVIDTTKVPDVVLTGMKALDNPVLVDSTQEKSISLPYDQSALTIEFTTLNFSKYYTVMYMMEGLDNRCRATSDMKVSYPYLPSGDYIFKVQAVNEEGIAGETIELLNIHVETAFWKSWWFWSIIGALVLGFLFWLDRRRIKRREFIQNMRTNIAVNLHEEVNTALNKINLLSEIAGMKADYEIEKSKEYIHQIRTKSRHMIVAMNDLLWSIEPSNDDMRKTTGRFTEYLHGLNNEVQGRFTLKVDNSVYQSNLDMQTRYHSLYLFKAVIENLVDFSVKNADLFLRIERNDLVYKVSVKDEHLNDYDVAGILKGSAIADRISQLNATAHIESQNGNHQLLFIIPLSDGKDG